MGANKRTPENAKIANAILQALFAEDGLTVQQVRDAISAESDEYQTVNGVLTSLGKREEIVRLNGRYFLTALGRKQVAPADAPPGPVKPAVAAPLPAPAPARNVEEPSKENVVTYPLSVLTDLVAQDDAASLADREREHAAEERAAQEALTALRSIEAAVLAHAPGLPADEQARRVIAMITGVKNVAADLATANAENVSLRADLDRLDAEIVAETLTSLIAAGWTRETTIARRAEWNSRKPNAYTVHAIELDLGYTMSDLKAAIGEHQATVAVCEDDLTPAFGIVRPDLRSVRSCSALLQRSRWPGSRGARRWVRRPWTRPPPRARRLPRDVWSASSTSCAGLSR
jgi:hypothetical protein